MLNTTQAPPLNENFELMGYENKNFLLNSGSFFIFLGLIVVYILSLKLIELFARCCPRKACCRRMGMSVFSKSKTTDVIRGSVKLFIESYFTLVLAVVLHICSFWEY